MLNNIKWKIIMIEFKPLEKKLKKGNYRSLKSIQKTDLLLIVFSFHI